jgi:hypothetical protein
MSYYVHLLKNPTTVCVTLLLSGDNYHDLALKMPRTLLTKNKFKFVDGSIQILKEDDLNFYALERCNNLVHSWIVNSTTPSVAESIVDRYMQGNQTHIARLQRDIVHLKQGNLTITEYFTELRHLWEELEQYLPTPQCNFHVLCSCVANSTKGVVSTNYRHAGGNIFSAF